MFDVSSLVEGEPKVANDNPEGGGSGNGPESTVILGTPLPEMLMCAITKWSIGRHLAIAEFVVARL